jgi:hypothetical protein
LLYFEPSVAINIFIFVASSVEITQFTFRLAASILPGAKGEMMKKFALAANFRAEFINAVTSFTGFL